MPDTTYRQKMFAFVEACAASGLTQKQWCADQGVTMDKFQYWKRRYKAAQHAQPATGRSFIPVNLPSLTAQPIAELHYPDGRRLLIHAGIDAPFLKALLS